jgi:plasma-membrane proton-efflux P-type ATPase
MTLGLSSAVAAERLETVGPNAVPSQRSHPLVAFLGRFWGLSAWMLELVALISFALHKTVDGALAAALLVVNAMISFFLEHRASTAVEALRTRLQVNSRALRDGVWKTLAARELVPGDLIRVRTGDFVPADGRVVDGQLRVDQSALTGESAEVERRTDDVLYSGAVVRAGEATALVTETGPRSFYGRTVRLVETARPTLHVEVVVRRVVKWLFVIVGVQTAVALAFAAVERISLVEILPLALVVLMGAVPIALPVMFTVSMAAGSMELARRGVLLTRLSAAEDAAHMNVVCVDKTGTLTQNRLAVTGVLPEPGFSADDVVRFGALASQQADQDPIDLALLREAEQRRLFASPPVTVSFTPFSAATRRTEALVQSDGGQLRVVKGALRTVAGLAELDASAVAALDRRTSEAAASAGGARTLAVARGAPGGPLQLVGVALLTDPPRADSRQLIDELRSLGVAVKMLTGDARAVARALARQLGLNEIVSVEQTRDGAKAGDAGDAGALAVIDRVDGIAEVFPEDKLRVVVALQGAGRVVGMTGDGVNDAPALRQAEVGIAVSGATDVTKGAASVVLTAEGLTSIVELVKNGRAIYQRVLTWIVNKISQTIVKTGFVVIPFLITGRFVISALAMLLLVFITDFSKVALATDRVRPSPMPETWDIAPFVRLATVFGCLVLVESLGVLALGWHWFSLGGDPGRLYTFAFITLLFFALFSIVSLRERRSFRASRPSRTLALALTFEGSVGLLVGLRGMGDLHALLPAQVLFVAGAAAILSVTVNDGVKRLLLRRSLS